MYEGGERHIVTRVVRNVLHPAGRDGGRRRAVLIEIGHFSYNVGCMLAKRNTRCIPPVCM